MTATLTASKTTVRYHPIRGAIYGLFFGLGLSLLLMVFKVLALSVPLIIVLGVVFLVLGGVWGRFAPPRRAKDPAPIARPTITGAPRTTTAPPAAPTPTPTAAPTPTAPPATPPTTTTPPPTTAQPQPPPMTPRQPPPATPSS